MKIITQKAGTQMTAHDPKAFGQKALGQKALDGQNAFGLTNTQPKQAARGQITQGGQVMKGRPEQDGTQSFGIAVDTAAPAGAAKQSAISRSDNSLPAMAARTVAHEVTFQGIGLHSGQSVTMRIQPAPAGHGILFRRIDLPEGRGDMPALWHNVVDTRLCTRLGNADGASVGTVEHIMAALAGCGITDALILLDGPEVPIMDGSSAPFVERLASIGSTETDAPISAIRILAPVELMEGNKRAALLPAERFEMDFSIDFDDPAIGTSRRMLRLTGNVFAEELGDCRTFGHLSEVERLRASGLGRGAV